MFLIRNPVEDFLSWSKFNLSYIPVQMDEGYWYEIKRVSVNFWKRLENFENIFYVQIYFYYFFKLSSRQSYSIFLDRHQQDNHSIQTSRAKFIVFRDDF